jgi:ribose transport system ATP-binding protein
MSVTPTLALRVEGVSKRFVATRALNDVSFDVASGSIHALLGGNGSGKSTLIKILAGVQPADSGFVTVGGVRQNATQTSAQWARAVGLRFVHQDIGVFQTLSVAENICLSQGYARHRPTGISWRTTETRVAALLEEWRIPVRPRDMMAQVRPADQTMIAIARALDTPIVADTDRSTEKGADEVQSLTLVLDEPTSALPEAEVERLLGWLRHSAAAGSTTIFVTHRLEEVLAVATDVTALRDGVHTATRAREAMQRSDLIDLIAASDDGETATAIGVRQAPRADEKPRLEVRELSGGQLRDVSFDIAPGEIVGIAGLLGSGRTRLMQYLAGVTKPDSGEIRLDGAKFSPWPERRAIRTGVALVPEDRAENGLFPGLTISENFEAGSLALRSPFSISLSPAMRRRAHRNVARYGVKAGGVSNDILTLSGGNQQKVLIGRWLSIGPRLILLDEPTVGVDVGARAALHRLIQESTASGASALCVSSDLYELIELCDRVLVLCNGTITDVIEGDRLTARTIGRAMHSSSETG